MYCNEFKGPVTLYGYYGSKFIKINKIYEQCQFKSISIQPIVSNLHDVTSKFIFKII